MKRLLAILLSSASLFAQTSSRLPLSGVAGITSSGGGGINIVQHRSKFCAATSCALAYSSNNASGNLLGYFCGSNNNTALSAATDNNTNTISNAINFTSGSLGAQRVDYVSSSHSGANTVTCTSSSAQRVYIFIWEVSGTTGTLDQHNTGTQASTSQSISTSSATTAANEVVFGYFFDQPNDDSLTAGTGFSPSEFVDGGSGNESGLTEVKIVSSTGTQTATATCGSGTNTIMQAIVTFK